MTAGLRRFRLLLMGNGAGIIKLNQLTFEVTDVRVRVFLPIILVTIFLCASPAFAQDFSYDTWTIPGSGSSMLSVNPADGTIWLFMHQSENLAALDPTDGSTIFDVPLTMRPTAIDFTPDGSMAFLVGEPLGDQIINTGLIQAIDTADGAVIMEFEFEGACNAVLVTDDHVLYTACGMQYGYQGVVYKVLYGFDEDGILSLGIDTQADCGKIPWGIAAYDGILYVTDLELQWTLQTDGYQGPPYGAYVWEYDLETLEYENASWVGINPNQLVVTSYGVVAACSGNKLGEGDLLEPALSIIEEPGASVPVFIGTTGASDLISGPDGQWMIASLADWGPPAPWSAMATMQTQFPGHFPEAQRWMYTGELAVLNLSGDHVDVTRHVILNETFFRALAISIDGSKIYALTGNPEQIIVFDTADLVN